MSLALIELGRIIEQISKNSLLLKKFFVLFKLSALFNLNE